MTEAEWLVSEDWAAMLEALSTPGDPVTDLMDRPISDRKLRLFACACCRDVWERFTELYPRRCVEAAERYADGERVKTKMEFAGSKYRTGHTSTLHNERIGLACCLEDASEAARQTSREHTLLYFDQADARRVQANLLREIIGNPFRPGLSWCDVPSQGRRLCYYERIPAMAEDRWDYRPHEWLTPTVVSIAQHAYDSRDFAGLPILADALEEAGCDNEDVLRHLRGWEKVDENTHSDHWIWKLTHRPHVRGCWCLDLLLGKE